MHRMGKKGFLVGCLKRATLAALATVFLMNVYTYVMDFSKPTILFVGDSVTDAKINYKLWRPYSLYRYFYLYKLPFYHESLYAHGGWCRLVGERKGLNWYNCGSGGATLADNGKPNAIVRRVKQLTKLKDFDYVIVSGGINDVRYNHWVGDDNSYSLHAFREICATLKSTHAKTGVLIPYYIGHDKGMLHNYGDSIKVLCEAYGIPYLDLRNTEVRLDTKEGRKAYGIDGWDWLHCNEKAYQIISDSICKWLDTL